MLMLPRSSAEILATAKPPPPKATRKQAKPQPSPSFSTQITTFPSTETTEMAEPTLPISQSSLSTFNRKVLPMVEGRM